MDSDILSTIEFDIIELDVEHVDYRWPPVDVD